MTIKSESVKGVRACREKSKEDRSQRGKRSHRGGLWGHHSEDLTNGERGQMCRLGPSEPPASYNVIGKGEQERESPCPKSKGIRL